MQKNDNRYQNAKCIMLSSGLVALIAGATGGQAQAANSQIAGLEEVLVTAQKREENLQETPISITALTEHTIDAMGIHNITDFSRYTPNLHIVSTAGDNTTSTIMIRGTANTTPAVVYEPTVGVYMDGVFVAKAAGSIFDLPDIERIEVLRGPQGALYGKNTIGGAINLINKKPSGEFDGRVEAEFGNFDYLKAKLSINLPSIGEIGEGLGRLSAKVAYVDTSRDGFFKNADTDGFFDSPASSDEFSNLDQQSGRVALVLDVTENFDIAYAYDFNRTEQNLPFYQLTKITENGIFDSQGALCSPVPIQGACMAFLGLESFVDKNRLDTGHNDNSFENNLDVDGHNLTISWNVGELGFWGDVAFKSITGHREFQETAFNDLDGSTIDLTEFIRDIEYEQFSQEFQMIGATDSVKYTLGLYYFEEEADVYGPQRFFGVFLPDGVGWTTNNYGIVGNDAWAVFGQADWSPQHFDGRLTVSLGARYTSESKELYRTRIESDGTASVPEGTTADDDYSDFSPSLAVSWYLNEESHVYGKISSGFRSGGFNDAANSVATFQLGFDQEELTAYEIGYKSRWMDNRLQFNTAVFFSDYTDMQISNSISDPIVGARSIINNAGAAEITGLELEIIAQPTADLNIMLSYGYLDAEYQEYLELDPATGVNVDVRKDRAFPFVAEHSGSLSVAWDMFHFDWGTLTGRLDYSYIDDHYTYAKNFESTKVDAYGLLDARLSLSEISLGNGDQHLEFALWAKNIKDEEYRTHGIDFGAFGYSGNYFGNPRTYGASISYQF